MGGTRRPVALLQLTSHRGLCALVRLSHLQMVPSELKVIIFFIHLSNIQQYIRKFSENFIYFLHLLKQFTGNDDSLDGEMSIEIV